MPITLAKLVKIHSQRTEELLAYYEEIHNRYGQLPHKLYPSHFQFDRVRVKVKVRTERRKYDDALEREREAMRRLGIDFDRETQNPYHHRSLDEMTEAQSTVEIVEWDRLREKLQRAVILGDPGFGKTWLLRYEARQIADDNRKALSKGRITLDEVIIPVFIRLPDLAEAPGEIEDAVCDVLKRDIKLNGIDLSEAFLTRLRKKIQSGQCRLLFDAFDEAPFALRDGLIERLSRFVKNHRNCRILLTSRIVGYREPFPLANTEAERELELTAFDREQQRKFIEAWFADQPDIGRSLIAEMEKAPQIRGLAQVPLMLGLICKLFWHNELTLPTRRVDLYETCLNGLLVKEWKATAEIPGQRRGYLLAKRRLAEHLAFSFFSKDQAILPCDDLLDEIQAYIEKAGTASPLSGKTADELLHELSEGEGLLVESGADDNPPYLFLHLTFQEYLAAFYMNRQSNPIELARERFWDFGWHETLALLAGMMEDPIPLLRAIIDEKDDIFSNLLLLAGRCLAECKESYHPLVAKIIDGIYELQEADFELIVQLGQAHSRICKRIQTDIQTIAQTDYTSPALRALLVNLWILPDIATPQAIEVLVDALYNKNDVVRERAAYLLEEIGDEQAVGPLVKAIHDKDSAVRVQAVMALGGIRSENVIEALIAARNDKDHDVRQKAAAALARIGREIRNEQLTEALIAALDDESVYVRHIVAITLGQIGGEQVTKALITALNDGEYLVTEYVTKALANIADEQSTEALVVALNHGNISVKGQAATALGQIGSQRAVEVSIKALHKHNLLGAW